MTKKSFLLELTPYNHSLLVSINQTNKDFKALLESYNVEYAAEDWEGGTYNARVIRYDNGAQVARFMNLRKNPFWQGIIAHESFHVVEFLFDRVGIKHSLETSEAYSYMIGYIVEKINKEIK